MELILVAIAYIIGILSGLYFKLGIVLLLLIIFLIYLIFKFSFYKKLKIKNNKNILNSIRYFKLLYSKKIIIIFLIFYLFSYFQIVIQEQSYKQKYKYTSDEIYIVGTIISNPTVKEYKTTYILKIESINDDKSFKNTRVLLNVSSGKNIKYFQYGNKIGFVGNFIDPEIVRNEGGFDYKAYLKTKRLYGTVKTQENNIKVIKENNSNLFLYLANITACKIDEKANEILPKTEASLLTGILIGNKDNLDDDIKEAFRTSNLSHMLAVSGAHVSYVIMGIGFIISKTKVGKKNGKILTIIFLLFFMIMTGQTPSVTRACIMAIYMIFASLFHKRVHVLSSLSFSILFILILNPYILFDIGLQLSFGGTIGIILLNKPLKQWFKSKTQTKDNKYQKIKNKMNEIVIVTISANLILFPIILYHFNTLSLIFVISNLIASPFMGILVLFGFITIIISFLIPPLGIILAYILKLILNMFSTMVVLLSKIPFAQILIVTPKIEYIFLYYLILALILFISYIQLKKRKRIIEKRIILIVDKLMKINKKIFIVIIIICITFNFIYRKIPKQLKINFIDVGQGDSCLVTTPREIKILIDGGGSEKKESCDVGKQVLIPYLLDKGITKIDYVIVSHFDSDHVGGILTVMEELKVGRVIISKQGENSENYKKFKEIIKEKKIKVQVVNKGDRVKIENDLYFDILWPNNEKLINENILNNNSIVCKLCYKNFSMLFTGDIEEIAEKQILKEYNNNLQVLNSTILKVGHHGSKTSSTQEFIEAVKPKIALIGVEENNKFGHPNDDVIKRLEDLGSKIYRTDQMGEIMLTIDNRCRIKVKKFIEQERIIN